MWNSINALTSAWWQLRRRKCWGKSKSNLSILLMTDGKTRKWSSRNSEHSKMLLVGIVQKCKYMSLQTSTAQLSEIFTEFPFSDLWTSLRMSCSTTSRVFRGEISISNWRDGVTTGGSSGNIQHWKTTWSTKKRRTETYIIGRNSVKKGRGRLKFGDSKQPAPFSSVIVIYRGPKVK